VSFDFLTDDVRNWVFAWYDYHRELGVAGLGQAPTNVMRDAGNYSPPFFYFLLLVAPLDAWLPKLVLVKLVPTLFDFAAAAVVYCVAWRATSRPVSPWVAFFAVLFAPTVLANSALWGQADSIPAAFVAAAVLGALARRPAGAALLVGVALAFKATAVFLAPFLAVLAFRGALAWRQLLLVPLGYFGLMLPALLAGRGLGDLATIYLRQGDLYHRLSMNAPNLYYLLPDGWYGVGVPVGLAVAALGCAAFVVLPVLRRTPLTPRFLLVAATFSLLLVPFLLPKMHDRYFFAVDILSIALVWFDRRLWYVPVLSQLSSALAYVPIISEAALGIDDGYIGLMPVAVGINTVLVALLAREYWRSSAPSRASAGGQVAG